MAETVAVEQDDDLYWTAGSNFVEVLVDGLNDSLKENGISDTEQRQKICSQFLFSIGYFLDQCGMEVEENKCYPLLCFTNRFLDIGVPLAEIEPLYLPVKDFEFHDAASGIVDDYFRTQGERSNIRLSPVGEE